MADYDLELTNDPAELKDIQRQLQSMLQTSGVRHSVISPLNVALGEWVENIIQYAYADGASHRIAIHCRVGPTEIELRISDDGRPFNPCEYPALDMAQDSKQAAQAGRGLHLIRQLMDRVEYQRQGANNILVLTKRLQQQPPPTMQSPVLVDAPARLDGMNSGDFGTMLTNLIKAGAHRLILDLSALEYLGSAGVRAFLLAQKAVAARGGKMALLNCRPSVREVLRICGVEQLAPTTESTEAAHRTVR